MMLADFHPATGSVSGKFIGGPLPSGSAAGASAPDLDIGVSAIDLTLVMAGLALLRGRCLVAVSRPNAMKKT